MQQTIRTSKVKNGCHTMSARSPRARRRLIPAFLLLYCVSMSSSLQINRPLREIRLLPVTKNRLVLRLYDKATKFQDILFRNINEKFDSGFDSLLRKAPRPPNYPPPMDRLSIDIPSGEEDENENENGNKNRSASEVREERFAEMLAKVQTLIVGVMSGFVAVAPTFWVRYYGMTLWELLFLFLWTGIQAGVFANIYRQAEATDTGILRDLLVLTFVGGRVYLQDPFMDISFKVNTLLESLVLFGGISLALDVCLWFNYIQRPRRHNK